MLQLARAPHSAALNAAGSQTQPPSSLTGSQQQRSPLLLLLQGPFKGRECTRRHLPKGHRMSPVVLATRASRSTRDSLILASGPA